MRAAESKRTLLLDAGDEDRLLALVDADPSWEAARDALAIRLLLATGLRVSSVVALDVEDIDAGHDRLSAPTKGGRRITVAVPRALGKALLEHAHLGPLFCSRDGTRLSVRQVQLRFAGWVEKAGVRAVTPHGLRHTFGTRMYEETRDLRRVQVALGHRSVGTTERYVAVG